MKNFSLVILSWITCTTIAIAHGDVHDTNNPETIATISSKKVIPDDNIRFDVVSATTSIHITNASPIKQLRVYNNNGKLIDTCKHLDQEYNYSTEKLKPGKYAFTFQIAEKVVTHIYEKK